MNDFLLNLVERAGNRAPVLQRRQRALFEPASPHASPDHDLGVRVEETESTRPASIENTLQQTLIVTREPAATHVAARVAPIEAPRAASASVIVGATSPTVRLERNEQRASPAPSAPPMPIAQSTLRAPRIDTPVVDAIAATPRGTSMTPAPARAANAAKMPATNLATPLSPISRAKKENKDAIVAAPLRRLMEPREPLTPSLRAPKPPSLRETAPAVWLAKARTTSMSAPIATAPAPAPVVISIGRVEVRAQTAPPARPRASATPSPRLTLEAYLRGRNGGAR
jgi:hypothetical protein